MSSKRTRKQVHCKDRLMVLIIIMIDYCHCVVYFAVVAFRCENLLRYSLSSKCTVLHKQHSWHSVTLPQFTLLKQIKEALAVF